MAVTKVSMEALRILDPLSSFLDARLKELADVCCIEQVHRTVDPFDLRPIAGQSVYVVRGELALVYGQGSSEVIVGGSAEARHPLGKRRLFSSAKAVTDVQLIRIDDDLLDIMLTWDQVAKHEQAGTRQPAERTPSGTDWGVMSGLFGINNLRFGAFSQLPPAHIDELLRRFERVEAKAGEVIIREGAEGDYYYLVESGRCQVERLIGGVSITLADIKSGDTFGEEALVAETKRNATVTMKTDGSLLRVAKQDFNALLREPLLHGINMEQARQKVSEGAQWIDVRYPSEYQYDRLPGARNIPLSEIRNAFGALDMSEEYIVYCQSGRRSSAAAFLLAQRGYHVFVLEGGLWGGDRLP
ncbi:MAG: cyclic nucleotide-binding domain-containing protein [Burkholderiales bacterium]|nr:cyclic nucleotide-binding domain-containing protein [Burkholderiales bacterium]